MSPRPWFAVVALAALTLDARAEDFTLSPPAPAIIAQDAGTVVAPDQIVALTADAAAADRLVAQAAAAGYTLLSRDALLRLGLVQLTFRRPVDVTPLGAIDALEAMEPGTTAGVNHAYRSGLERADPAIRRYAGALVDWPETGCSAKVPVGILDTGLAAAALPPGAQIVQETFASAGETEHGTAVAELLAGPGRLTRAKLFHAAVVGPVQGETPAAGVDAILQGLDWLSANGVRLVNVSLAGPYNKILDRGLQAAARDGMILVAAAGNDGPDAAPRYPAAFPSTIAVTAIDAALRAYKGAPEGEHIDIAAPGVDVYIASAGAGRYLSGTSLAAPFVTAAIAADPEAAHAPIEDLRLWLAGRSRDLGDPGPDTRFGLGLIQSGCP